MLDIETTGSRPGPCDLITEIGAVKVRGGECLGTLATLVNPGKAIAPQVTLLTGITQSMVATAPRIEAVLPSLQEFIGDAVVVGHNVGFDMSFINAAMLRADRHSFRNTVVDTLPLARRLVRDEVPDCRLGTLAARFRLDHRPPTVRSTTRWPPPTCCTCCSSGPAGLGRAAASTTSWVCPPWAATLRRGS